MGGGNAQKSKMAREKNLEKAKAAAKGSQLESNKKAMTIQESGSLPPVVALFIGLKTLLSLTLKTNMSFMKVASSALSM
ncbi:hypothetical protein V6N12_016335 [Hibiscus sabdariffa]|uniref:Small EDRK-rich factor-like N-terminal domain-containing protein n=1 Tax=Hibiscus sabdariffa TaxID=183260 RepID=A0ABR2CDB8_9ROSI